MNKRYLLFLFSILLIYLFSTQAVSAQVSGRIYDAISGEPLISATVQVRGTTIGTITDIDGKYRLTAIPEGRQVLLFSYISYASDSLVVDIVRGNDLSNIDAPLNPAGLIGETVIVTSQRQGQSAAINQQMKANSIVNVVSAERIRELPDENAAESVARLPGVSVQRSGGGEGQRVNIRGLSPKFSAVALDGVAIPPTGQGRSIFNLNAGSGGSTNPSVDDRSVDLSMISSDALAGIEVYKSLTPDQDGDAIGGRVNFVSAKAPKIQKVYLTALGGHNHYHGSFDNLKLTGTYSRRYLKDRLGIIATGAYNNIDRSSDQVGIDYVFQSEPVLNGFSLNDNIRRRKRYNASLAIDYDFGKGHELFLNSMYGRTDVENVNRNFSIRPRVNNGGAGAGVGGGKIDLTNVSLTGRHPFQGIELDWKGSFVRTTDENIPGYGYGFGAFDPFAGNEIPQSDADLAFERFRFDPDFFRGGGPGGEDMNNRTDNNYIAQLNAKRRYTLANGKISGFLKAGAKYWVKQRTRRSSNSTFFPQSWNNIYPQIFPEGQFIFNGPAAEPFVDPEHDLTDFFDGQYPIPFSIDPLRAEELFDLTRDFRRLRIAQGLGNYDANERITAGYLMTDVQLGRRLNIVGGLRYEHMDSDYAANEIIRYQEGQGPGPDFEPEVINGSVNERTSGQNYGELLPMVNMKWNILANNDNSNGMDLRLSVTRSLVRPDFRNLTPFISIYPQTVERAQPDLLPTTAWNYDAFLTLFNNRFGLFTVGAFYKELQNVDYPVAFNQDGSFLFQEFGGAYPDEFAAMGGQRRILSEPRNSPDLTTVQGLELEVQSNLSWLPSPFDGVVLYGNVAFIDSEITLPTRVPILDTVTFVTTVIDSSRTTTMPGQTNLTANVSLGYDKGRFSGRISYNYQGPSITFIGPNEDLDGYVDAFARTDISAKYKITDNLTAMLNVNNVFNRFDAERFGLQDLRGSSTIYGTMTWLGLRYVLVGKRSERVPNN